MLLVLLTVFISVTPGDTLPDTVMARGNLHHRLNWNVRIGVSRDKSKLVVPPMTPLAVISYRWRAFAQKLDRKAQILAQTARGLISTSSPPLLT